MNTKRSLSLRLISLNVAMIFAFSSLAEAAPILGAMPTPHFAVTQALIQDPGRLEIPFEHASLKEYWRGTNGRLVVHVQDAHLNLSGQQSLAGGLDQIMSKYDMPLVLVEGADRDVSLNEVRGSLPLKTWQIAAKRFLYDGMISGEEYLNLTSERDMKIIGVEYRYLYDENLKAYAELAESRREILLYLRRAKQALNLVKNQLYPKPLLNFDARKVQSDRGNFKSNMDGIYELANLADLEIAESYPAAERLRQLRLKEAELDFGKANREQIELFGKLSRYGVSRKLQEHMQAARKLKNTQVSQEVLLRNLFSLAERYKVDTAIYPELMKLKSYLREFSQLDLNQLLNELEELEDDAFWALLGSEDAKRIRAIDRYLGLLEKAYAIQMSSTEFKQFLANEPDFPTQSWQAFLNRKLIDLKKYEDVVPYQPLLEQARQALERFYALVDRRDFAFVENTKSIMQNENQSSAFLIAGGYHTDHLTELLREEGTSYIVLTPIVTYETDIEKYEEILLEPIKQAKRQKRRLEMRSAEAQAAESKRNGIRAMAGLLKGRQHWADYAEKLGDLTAPAAQIFGARAVPNERLSDLLIEKIDQVDTGSQTAIPKRLEDTSESATAVELALSTSGSRNMVRIRRSVEKHFSLSAEMQERYEQTTTALGWESLRQAGAETLEEEMQLEGAFRVNETGANSDVQLYSVTSDKGVFLVITEHGEIQDIVLMVEFDANARTYVAFREEPFYEDLMRLMTKHLRQARQKAGRDEDVTSQNFRFYTPFAIGDTEESVLHDRLSRNFFSAYLMHDSVHSDLPFGLSDTYVLHGADHLLRHHGGLSRKDDSQIFEALPTRRLGHDGDLSAITPAHSIVRIVSHEIVHLYFGRIKSDPDLYKILDEGMVASDSKRRAGSVLRELVPKYLGSQFGGQGFFEQNREAVLDEALAMIFDSFMKPTIDERGNAIIRDALYPLTSSDVKLLIDVGLLPPALDPARLGYGEGTVKGNRIDLAYYGALYAALQVAGWSDFVQDLISDVSFTYANTAEIKRLGLKLDTERRTQRLREKRRTAQSEAEDGAGGTEEAGSRIEGVPDTDEARALVAEIEALDENPRFGGSPLRYSGQRSDREKELSFLYAWFESEKAKDAGWTPERFADYMATTVPQYEAAYTKRYEEVTGRSETFEFPKIYVIGSSMMGIESIRYVAPDPGADLEGGLIANVMPASYRSSDMNYEQFLNEELSHHLFAEGSALSLADRALEIASGLRDHRYLEMAQLEQGQEDVLVRLANRYMDDYSGFEEVLVDKVQMELFPDEFISSRRQLSLDIPVHDLETFMIPFQPGGKTPGHHNIVREIGIFAYNAFLARLVGVEDIQAQWEDLGRNYSQQTSDALSQSFPPDLFDQMLDSYQLVYDSVSLKQAGQPRQDEQAVAGSRNWMPIPATAEAQAMMRRIETLYEQERFRGAVVKGSDQHQRADVDDRAFLYNFFTSPQTIRVGWTPERMVQYVSQTVPLREAEYNRRYTALTGQPGNFTLPNIAAVDDTHEIETIAFMHLSVTDDLRAAVLLVNVEHDERYDHPHYFEGALDEELSHLLFVEGRGALNLHPELEIAMGMPTHYYLEMQEFSEDQQRELIKLGSEYGVEYPGFEEVLVDKIQMQINPNEFIERRRSYLAAEAVPDLAHTLQGMVDHRINPNRKFMARKLLALSAYHMYLAELVGEAVSAFRAWATYGEQLNRELTRVFGDNWIEEGMFFRLFKSYQLIHESVRFKTADGQAEPAGSRESIQQLLDHERFTGVLRRENGGYRLVGANEIRTVLEEYFASDEAARWGWTPEAVIKYLAERVPESEKLFNERLRERSSVTADMRLRTAYVVGRATEQRNRSRLNSVGYIHPLPELGISTGGLVINLEPNIDVTEEDYNLGVLEEQAHQLFGLGANVPLTQESRQRYIANGVPDHEYLDMTLTPQNLRTLRAFTETYGRFTPFLEEVLVDKIQVQLVPDEFLKLYGYVVDGSNPPAFDHESRRLNEIGLDDQAVISTVRNLARYAYMTFIAYLMENRDKGRQWMRAADRLNGAATQHFGLLPADEATEAQYRIPPGLYSHFLRMYGVVYSAVSLKGYSAPPPQIRPLTQISWEIFGDQLEEYRRNLADTTSDDPLRATKLLAQRRRLEINLQALEPRHSLDDLLAQRQTVQNIMDENEAEAEALRAFERAYPNGITAGMDFVDIVHATRRWQSLQGPKPSSSRFRYGDHSSSVVSPFVVYLRRIRDDRSLNDEARRQAYDMALQNALWLSVTLYPGDAENHAHEIGKMTRQVTGLDLSGSRVTWSEFVGLYRAHIRDLPREAKQLGATARAEFETRNRLREFVMDRFLSKLDPGMTVRQLLDMENRGSVYLKDKIDQEQEPLQSEAEKLKDEFDRKFPNGLTDGLTFGELREAIDIYRRMNSSDVSFELLVLNENHKALIERALVKQLDLVLDNDISSLEERRDALHIIRGIALDLSATLYAWHPRHTDGSFAKNLNTIFEAKLKRLNKSGARAHTDEEITLIKDAVRRDLAQLGQAGLVAGDLHERARLQLVGDDARSLILRVPNWPMGDQLSDPQIYKHTKKPRSAILRSKLGHIGDRRTEAEFASALNQDDRRRVVATTDLPLDGVGIDGDGIFMRKTEGVDLRVAFWVRRPELALAQKLQLRGDLLRMYIRSIYNLLALNVFLVDPVSRNFALVEYIERGRENLFLELVDTEQALEFDTQGFWPAKYGLDSSGERIDVINQRRALLFLFFAFRDFLIDRVVRYDSGELRIDEETFAATAMVRKLMVDALKNVAIDNNNPNARLNVMIELLESERWREIILMLRRWEIAQVMPDIENFSTDQAWAFLDQIAPNAYERFRNEVLTISQYEGAVPRVRSSGLKFQDSFTHDEAGVATRRRKVVQVPSGARHSFENYAEKLRDLMSQRHAIVEQWMDAMPEDRAGVLDLLHTMRTQLSIGGGIGLGRQIQAVNESDDVLVDLALDYTDTGFTKDNTAREAVARYAAALSVDKSVMNREELERALATIVDAYLFHHLAMLSILAKDHDLSVSQARVRSLEDLLQELQSGAQASGQMFVRHVTTLFMFGKSIFSFNEEDYTTFERWILGLGPEYSIPYALNIVTRLGNHLRGQRVEQSRLYEVNRADYRMLALSLAALLSEYDRLAQSDQLSSSLALDIRQALVVAFAGDMPTFFDRPNFEAAVFNPALTPATTNERPQQFFNDLVLREALDQYFAHLLTHQREIGESIGDLQPSEGRYTPLIRRDIYADDFLNAMVVSAIFNPQDASFAYEDHLVRELAGGDRLEWNQHLDQTITRVTHAGHFRERSARHPINEYSDKEWPRRMRGAFEVVREALTTRTIKSTAIMTENLERFAWFPDRQGEYEISGDLVLSGADVQIDLEAPPLEGLLPGGGVEAALKVRGFVAPQKLERFIVDSHTSGAVEDLRTFAGEFREFATQVTDQPGGVVGARSGELDLSTHTHALDLLRFIIREYQRVFDPYDYAKGYTSLTINAALKYETQVKSNAQAAGNGAQLEQGLENEIRSFVSGALRRLEIEPIAPEVFEAELASKQDLGERMLVAFQYMGASPENRLLRRSAYQTMFSLIESEVALRDESEQLQLINALFASLEADWDQRPEWSDEQAQAFNSFLSDIAEKHASVSIKNREAWKGLRSITLTPSTLYAGLVRGMRLEELKMIVRTGKVVNLEGNDAFDEEANVGGFQYPTSAEGRDNDREVDVFLSVPRWSLRRTTYALGLTMPGAAAADPDYVATAQTVLTEASDYVADHASDYAKREADYVARHSERKPELAKLGFALLPENSKFVDQQRTVKKLGDYIAKLSRVKLVEVPARFVDWQRTFTHNTVRFAKEPERFASEIKPVLEEAQATYGSRTTLIKEFGGNAQEILTLLEVDDAPEEMPLYTPVFVSGKSNGYRHQLAPPSGPEVTFFTKETSHSELLVMQLARAENLTPEYIAIPPASGSSRARYAQKAADGDALATYKVQSAQDAINLANALGAALGRLHAAGVIHGDLGLETDFKPGMAHIFVTRDTSGELLIQFIDFGNSSSKQPTGFFDEPKEYRDFMAHIAESIWVNLSRRTPLVARGIEGKEGLSVFKDTITQSFQDGYQTAQAQARPADETDVTGARIGEDLQQARFLRELAPFGSRVLLGAQAASVELEMFRRLNQRRVFDDGLPRYIDALDSKGMFAVQKLKLSNGRTQLALLPGREPLAMKVASDVASLTARVAPAATERLKVRTQPMTSIERYRLRNQWTKANAHINELLSRGPLGLVVEVDGLTEKTGIVTDAASANLSILKAMADRYRGQGGSIALVARDPRNQALIDYVLNPDNGFSGTFASLSTVDAVPHARLVPAGSLRVDQSIGAYALYAKTTSEIMTPLVEAINVSFSQAYTGQKIAVGESIRPHHSIVDLIVRGSNLRNPNQVRASLMDAAAGNTTQTVLARMDLMVIRVLQIPIDEVLSGARAILKLIGSAA